MLAAVAMILGVLSYLAYQQSAMSYPELLSNDGYIKASSPTTANVALHLASPTAASIGETPQATLELQWLTQTRERFHLILHFEEEARSTEYVTGSPELAVLAVFDEFDDDGEEILVSIDPSKVRDELVDGYYTGTSSISLMLYEPVAVEAMGKVVVDSPTLAQSFPCAALDGTDPTTMEERAALIVPGWYDCQNADPTIALPEDDARYRQTVTVTPREASGLRLESAFGTPSLRIGLFRHGLNIYWEDQQRIDAIGIFVDPVAENTGQRYLFWSGVAGGLAGGVATMCLDAILRRKQG
ncbi:hypothetical protein AB0J89_07070 [Micromonospora chokoriensis]